MSREHRESQLESRVIRRILAASGCLAEFVNAHIDQIEGCREGSRAEVDWPNASCIRVCSFERAPSCLMCSGVSPELE